MTNYMKDNIPLFRVFMPEDIGPLVIKTLTSGQIAEGPKVSEFEKSLGDYIGNPNVVATNSGSGALSIALKLAGVVHGSEVITTSMTCQATNQPILQLGGKIVWADIQKETGNIDPVDVEKKITRNTKAIIAMHWAGQPCDLNELSRITKKYDIKLIEDAASAFGATYNGKIIGNHSDFVCFSFGAVKHITTGDGGALVLKDTDALKRAVLLRNNGNDKSASRTSTEWHFNISEAGWKFHMNDLAATIGLKQLEYHYDLLEKRRKNGHYFVDQLVNIEGLKTLEQKINRESAYWIFTLLVDEREPFVNQMKANGIHTGIVHQRNDHHTLYQEYASDLPNLDYFSERMINIPVGWWVEKNDLYRIVDVIKKGW
jgi:perosamine synthetase